MKLPVIRSEGLQLFLVDRSPDDLLAEHQALYLRELTDKQAVGLMMLVKGCRMSNRTLANGKPVKDKGGAVRWLLEQLEAKADAKPEE